MKEVVKYLTGDEKIKQMHNCAISLDSFQRMKILELSAIMKQETGMWFKVSFWFNRDEDVILFLLKT